MTAVRTAFEYLAMFMVAGLMIWFLGPILGVFRPLSETGDVYTYANYMWYGIIPIIIIFSIFWFFRRLREWDTTRRY